MIILHVFRESYLSYRIHFPEQNISEAIIPMTELLAHIKIDIFEFSGEINILF